MDLVVPRSKIVIEKPIHLTSCPTTIVYPLVGVSISSLKALKVLVSPYSCLSTCVWPEIVCNLS